MSFKQESKSGVIRKRSPRWHFTHEGRSYSVYCPTRGDAEKAAHAHTGSIDAASTVAASGYYDYATNRIVDSQDGPMVLIDARKSGM